MKTIKEKLAYIYGFLSLYGRLPMVFIESMTEKERLEMADYITSNFSPDNEALFIIHANL